MGFNQILRVIKGCMGSYGCIYDPWHLLSITFTITIYLALAMVITTVYTTLGIYLALAMALAITITIYSAWQYDPIRPTPGKLPSFAWVLKLIKFDLKRKL